MNDAAETESALVRGGQVWPLSIAAYHALADAGLIPENTELLYGTVYRKMSKSPYHSALVARIQRLLMRILPDAFFIRCEQPISCPDSEPEPDLAIVRGAAEDFWDEHPRTAELVIEVCVTSHDFDRAKLRAYASAGVKECWLVLGPEKQIERYTVPTAEIFLERQIQGPGGRIESAGLPGLSLVLEAVFNR